MIRLVSLLSFPTLLAGCLSVDFSEPEMALPARYAAGADIRLTSYEGGNSWGVSAEGPSLTILHDQLSYGVLRCSRPGPRLDLELDAGFSSTKGPDRLLGVATWRDPATREVVGRHHIDVAVDIDNADRRHVSQSTDDDGFGSWVPNGQLAAGEVFVAQVCEKAFGWSGLSPR